MASLNHPHVLRVFDWGEENDEPYFVLEYLGGGSLRDLEDRGVKLTHAQAAQLGAEVSRASPMRTCGGWCTATSSRRTSCSTRRDASGLRTSAWPVRWRRPRGQSPRGRWWGPLATSRPRRRRASRWKGRPTSTPWRLVLYEAVTGSVPFVTDTTMGTLAARIGQPLPHDALLGPLDDVLARAATPDVTARLDAAGLGARFGALAAALPTPAPLPLVFQHLEGQRRSPGFTRRGWASSRTRG